MITNVSTPAACDRIESEHGLVPANGAAPNTVVAPLIDTQRSEMDLAWLRMIDAMDRIAEGDPGAASAEQSSAELAWEALAGEDVTAVWSTEVTAVEPAPTFSNVVVLRDQTEALTAGARTLIGEWRGSGTLLVVTHGANIRAMTGISPSTGEIVVVNGSAEPVGRIPPPR